jgi:hypothetical protein
MADSLLVLGLAQKPLNRSQLHFFAVLIVKRREFCKSPVAAAVRSLSWFICERWLRKIIEGRLSHGSFSRASSTFGPPSLADAWKLFAVHIQSLLGRQRHPVRDSLMQHSFITNVSN